MRPQVIAFSIPPELVTVSQTEGSPERGSQSADRIDKAVHRLRQAACPSPFLRSAWLPAQLC